MTPLRRFLNPVATGLADVSTTRRVSMEYVCRCGGRDSRVWSSPLLTFYCPTRPCIPPDNAFVCSAPRGADATREVRHQLPTILLVGSPVANPGPQSSTI